LLGILLVLGSCAFIILMPTRLWLHGPSARIIMEIWSGGEDPRTTKADLVAAMVEAQGRNSTELGRRAQAYRLAVLLLLVQVLTLVAAVAQSSAG
jgi:hypothetical protein